MGWTKKIRLVLTRAGLGILPGITKAMLMLWRWQPAIFKARLLDAFTQSSVGHLDYRHGKPFNIFLTSPVSIMRLHSCAKEPGTVKWIEDFFRPGDVFYDIGANIGAYSFVAYRRLNGQVKIYAFEPGFSTYVELCRNILLNGAQSEIIPISTPLTSNTGYREFQYSSILGGEARHQGLGSTSPEQVRDKNVFNQLIYASTLDVLAREAGLAPPTHIKIDVDGHEKSVLLGAFEILSLSSLRSIQIELDDDMPETKEITDLLNKHGFSVNRKNPHPPSSIYDFVFIRH